MRKLLLISLLNFICCGIIAQNDELRLIVIRTIPTKAHKLSLQYEIAGKEYKDSFVLNSQQTIFRKKLLQPVAAIITTDVKSIKGRKLFLSNRAIEIEVTEKSLVVKADSIQTNFEELTVNDEIRPAYFPLYGELLDKNDTAGLNKLSILFDSLKQDDIKKAYLFTKANKNSPLVLFAFQRYSSFKADYSLIEPDFAELPSWARNSLDGKLISQKITGVKNGTVGKSAINFIQTAATGKKVAFSSYKGKYIFLDFWASWCVPCRKEHPGLVTLYDRYKNKNFEIISVSLDNSKQAWFNAIAKDKMKWINLSDLKGQQNDVAVKFGIQAIPANFLIDPNGIIIAKNLTAEELSTKLNELIK